MIVLLGKTFSVSPNSVFIIVCPKIFHAFPFTVGIWASTRLCFQVSDALETWACPARPSLWAHTVACLGVSPTSWVTRKAPVCLRLCSEVLLPHSLCLMWVILELLSKSLAESQERRVGWQVGNWVLLLALSSKSGGRGLGAHVGLPIPSLSLPVRSSLPIP